jgi:hypothetical protein
LLSTLRLIHIISENSAGDNAEFNCNVRMTSTFSLVCVIDR